MKTTFLSGMACCPGLIYLQQDRITIAVELEIDHLLEVSGALTFNPEPLPTSAEISCALRL
jgi:hypothetical protein